MRTALADRELLARCTYHLALNHLARGEHEEAVEAFTRLTDGPDADLARQLSLGSQAVTWAEGALLDEAAHVREGLGLVAEGKLRVVVDRVFPLDEAGMAHSYLESGQAVGKVVLSTQP